MVTRLVNATYPDYTQIIPKTFTSTATVPKKDLEVALKQSAVFSDTFQKIKVSYEASKKQIVLTAKNNDIGETVERVHATISGDSIELAFNHKYLQAPLHSISTASIELKSAGIGRPLIMQGVGDTTYKYLVMPMNQ
jgi:DNA polymerase-3 subunit beta